MHSMKVYKSALYIIFAYLISVNPSFAASPFPIRGGSNLVFNAAYQNDGHCHWIPYGLLKHYNKNTELVNNQLKRMYNNGERRLRTLIWYSENKPKGLHSGFSFYIGGGQTELLKSNLSNLLSEITEIGYKAIIVSFAPLDDSNPRNWNGWNDASYQTNLSLIWQIRSILANSGIKQYKIDLRNEGVPGDYAQNRTIQLRYAKQLWKDYTAMFGKSDTLGFSLGTGGGNGSNGQYLGLKSRIDNFKYIYGSNPPNFFDIHIYGDSPQDTLNILSITDKKLHEEGYNQGIIIGETYYNDPVMAFVISSEYKKLYRQIFYILQWPKTRGAECGVNVAPPDNYGHYQKLLDYLHGK